MRKTNTLATPNNIGDAQPCQLNRYRLPEQPRAPSDEAVCKSVRSVEELRAFINQNFDSIARKAFSLCYGSHEHAQEVLQELYPRLLSVLERSSQGLENPMAVVHQVASRLAIDCYRRTTKRQTVKQLAEPESVIDESQRDPHEFDDLHKAVNALPKKMKTVVLGIFVEGCKAKDISARVNLSETRIAELKKEALDMLRESLSESEK